MKIAVLEPLGTEKEKLLEIAKSTLADSFQIDYYGDRQEDEKTLIERSADAEVVLLSNIKYTKEIMQHNPNLKMLCVAFTGVDHIDMEYCKQNNILVCNASGYATTAVAELVFWLLGAVYRNIIECDAKTREQGTKDGLVGSEIAGKTFGVVGFGEIGSAVAGIANAFGCEVLAYSRSPKQSEFVNFVDLDELLSRSDIVSLHVPLNPETRNMISKREIGLMKGSAVLINTARGPVVDNVALSDALKQNKIAGAGIDVFDMEPPIPNDYILLDAPNTVLTPHVAFATKESMVKRAIIAFENIKQWADGTPQNVVK